MAQEKALCAGTLTAQRCGNTPYTCTSGHTFCRAMQIQSGVTSPRGGHRMNFKRPTAASDTGQCGDCYN